MSDHQDLNILLRGHAPIIAIETHEEPRAIASIEKTASVYDTAVFSWSVTEGMSRRDKSLGTQRHLSQPIDILKHIKATDFPGYYILLDFHHYLADPVNQRYIREISNQFESNGSKLIFISPTLSLPLELQKQAVQHQLKLPDQDLLEELIRDEAIKWYENNNQPVKTSKRSLRRLAQNLKGLTLKDAKRMIRTAIIDDNAITEDDIPTLLNTKYKFLNQDEILAYEFDTSSFSDIGGMKKLKDWLKVRKKIFTDDQNIPYGLDKPKGMLLLGVQGGGKSLAAKAVAGVWGVPLLRLDFGRLYNKYIGETEKNIREALKTAEIMSPCVLWIDEIEKGVSTGNDEDGTSQRILATLLTWMAENKKSVFIVATANSINNLPPELIRKGRLDEIFFIDLPSDSARKNIFEIHLKKRDFSPSEFDLDSLASAAEGFSGAEIEQAIVASIYSAYHEGEKLDTAEILESIKLTRPLSVVMAEEIGFLRNWAKDRTVPAD